jgi:hypothetical protein
MNQDNHKNKENHNFRLYQPLKDGSHTFGEHWFALKAEAFARLFGTPKFWFAKL